jgi:hypothetical protein
MASEADYTEDVPSDIWRQLTSIAGATPANTGNLFADRPHRSAEIQHPNNS